MSGGRDTLFQRPRASGDFQFDEQVAEVFPDMLQRSVPGYGMMLDGIRLIARRQVQPGSRVYDLGCSLGAASLAVIEGATHADFQAIAVDSAAAMIRRCRERHAGLRPCPEWRHADIRDTAIEDASLVMLNLTLQFIPIGERLGLLRRIRNGLRPGGLFLLSEKIDFESPEIAVEMTELHHDFKRAHGYSDMEIAAKRDALEDVLFPETLDRHRQRLAEAGFGRVQCWFQCFNFISLLAWRS